MPKKIRIINKPACGAFSKNKNYEVKGFEKDGYSDKQYLIKDDNGIYVWVSDAHVIEI